MGDEGLPASVEAEFNRIDARLDALAEKIGACRQAMVLGRAAVVLGLGTLAVVFTVAPAYDSAPVVLSAITASLAGTVWLGASKSSLEDLQAGQASVEAEKNALFDHVARLNGWVQGTVQ